MITKVNVTENWCDVELINGNTLFKIPFRASQLRLRSLQQAVVLTEVLGNRQRFIITGESNIKIDSTAFAPKGTFIWDDGSLWDDYWIWA